MALAISAAQDSVKIGAPVRIQVALTNKSDRDVTFSRDGAGYDCRLDVRDINGNLLADSKFGYLRNGHVAHPDPTRFSPEDLKGRLVVVTVKAGQTLTWEEDAAKLYEIDPPGEYTIQGQEPEPGNMSVSLKSNTITVTSARAHSCFPNTIGMEPEMLNEAGADGSFTRKSKTPKGI
jgi:hypothetical protein